MDRPAHFRFYPLTLLLAAAQCGSQDDALGDSSGDDESTGTMSADTTTGGSTGGSTGSSSDDPACACLTEAGNAYNLPDPIACGAELCSVIATCGGTSKFGLYCEDPFEVDEMQLGCALTALRDRTPGVVVWDVEQEPGFAYRHGYIVILEDGRVMTQAVDAVDKAYQQTDAVLGTPPPAADVDACRGLEPQAQFECLDFVPASPSTVCRPADF